MVIGATEVFTVVAVGVVGHIGSVVLEKAGKEGLSKTLDVVIYVAGMIVAIKFWREGVEFVEKIFGVFF